MNKIVWLIVAVLGIACTTTESAPDINTLRYTGFNVKVAGAINLTLPYKVTNDTLPASVQWLTNVDIDEQTLPQVLRFHHPQAGYMIELFTDAKPSSGALVLSMELMDTANPYFARLVSDDGKIYDRNVGGSITIERVSETVMMIDNRDYVIDEITGHFNFIAEADDGATVQVTGDFMGIPRLR